MACFLVPAAEAVISTIITKAVQKKEKSENTVVTAESTLERHRQSILKRHLMYVQMLHIRKQRHRDIRAEFLSHEN